MAILGDTVQAKKDESASVRMKWMLGLLVGLTLVLAVGCLLAHNESLITIPYIPRAAHHRYSTDDIDSSVCRELFLLVQDNTKIKILTYYYDMNLRSNLKTPAFSFCNKTSLMWHLNFNVAIDNRSLKSADEDTLASGSNMTSLYENNLVDKMMLYASVVLNLNASGNDTLIHIIGIRHLNANQCIQFIRNVIVASKVAFILEVFFMCLSSIFSALSNAIISGYTLLSNAVHEFRGNVHVVVPTTVATHASDPTGLRLYDNISQVQSDFRNVQSPNLLYIIAVILAVMVILMSQASAIENSSRALDGKHFCDNPNKDLYHISNLTTENGTSSASDTSENSEHSLDTSIHEQTTSVPEMKVASPVCKTNGSTPPKLTGDPGMKLNSSTRSLPTRCYFSRMLHLLPEPVPSLLNKFQSLPTMHETKTTIVDMFHSTKMWCLDGWDCLNNFLHENDQKDYVFGSRWVDSFVRFSLPVAAAVVFFIILRHPVFWAFNVKGPIAAQQDCHDLPIQLPSPFLNLSSSYRNGCVASFKSHSFFPPPSSSSLLKRVPSWFSSVQVYGHAVNHCIFPVQNFRNEETGEEVNPFMDFMMLARQSLTSPNCSEMVGFANSCQQSLRPVQESANEEVEVDQEVENESGTESSHGVTAGAEIRYQHPSAVKGFSCSTAWFS